MEHSFKTACAVAALIAQVGSGIAKDSQRSGVFAGRSGHATSGGVTVTRSGGQTTLSMHGDFRLDGAPDPWMGFGKGGRYIQSTQFRKLRKLSGQQTYIVPARIDVGDIDEVFIWCQKYSTPLGVAKLR